jgi:hypothetical protein|tara:strand:+ start:1308 stop:1529 length:222 start_codon:yes stop_codon:yes gene_type:complete
MVKTLILLILLFDGTLVKKEIKFSPSVSLKECYTQARAHRDSIAKYIGPEIKGSNQGWYLLDNTGTYHGFICE